LNGLSVSPVRSRGIFSTRSLMMFRWISSVPPAIEVAGTDLSVKETSVCVVDDAGKVILEQKVRTEPEDIIALLTSLGATFGRIGIEAGPLSQWLVNALTAADLPVICVETRHMKALLTAQQINKTDRNDARGIAQMMRVGLFKPVHVKTLAAQEQRC